MLACSQATADALLQRVVPEIMASPGSALLVAPLLAYLRELLRRYSPSVVLVDHARKGGGK